MGKNSCFYPADIMLPKENFEKWAVIACDQYTSEPEYWERVEKYVGESPSALRLILPEAYLSADNSKRIADINSAMSEYQKNGVFRTLENSCIYVERTQSDGVIRKGIIGKIDLSEYDYISGTDAAIRATEQTVIERIPPRVEIRRDVPLELPHVMLLADDPENIAFGVVEGEKESFEVLYDFDLMENAGHIIGRLIPDHIVKELTSAFERVAQRNGGLMFCVGDGNHSLATAKECYRNAPDELSRFALAEIVNIHDPALQFEPIYRIVFGVFPETLIDRFVQSLGGEYHGKDAQHFKCVYKENIREISVKGNSKLCVGTLQNFLDDYLKTDKNASVDYIHGENSLKKLCLADNTVGFLFEGMQKNELFPAVLADGSLPRKTFSMGHADDKRFYIEARKIK